MKLTIKERLTIGNIYPKESNIINQTIIKGASEKVNITQDEIKEINLRTEGGMFLWDKDKGKDKEVKFSALELQLLKDQVDKLDKGNKITMDILDLCLKIREEKNG